MKIKIIILILLLTIILTGCKNDNKKCLENYNKGKIYFINQNMEKAILFFKQALKENKKHYPSYVMIGKAYYYSGNIKKAEELFKKLLKINKHSINAMIWLARIKCVDEKKHKEALKYCDNILKLDMDNHDAHFFRALVYQQQNNIAEAIKELNHAIQAEKVIYLSHLTLGDIYYNNGIKDKAIIEYKKILNYNLNPKIKKDLQERIKKYEKN